MHYITKEGLEKLKQELEHLKTVKRKEITERLRKAVSFGDLSENFDYHNAREEQDMLERRIKELEETLANVSVVEGAKGSDGVRIGSTVRVKNDGKIFTFLITGPQEANPLENKISAESPLGQALLGRRKNDKVSVATPNGNTLYTVLDIL